MVEYYESEYLLPGFTVYNSPFVLIKIFVPLYVSPWGAYATSNSSGIGRDAPWALVAITKRYTMKYFISYLFLFPILACSNGQKKSLSENPGLKIYEKKYDSLRTVLKDSLAKGIKNVNDYDHIFMTAEEKYLDSLISEFKRKTGIQLVIFTFDSLMVPKDSVETVTQIICIKNKINTTVGFSFSNRSMTIWNDSLTNKTLLNEDEAQHIIDEKFIPLFKNGESFRGTVEGIKAIMQRMASNQKQKRAS